MDLCIDIGNTRAKVASIEKEKFSKVHYRDDIDVEWLQDFIDENQIERLIFSSTRILSDEMREFLDGNDNYFTLNHKLPIPIQNKYGTPETLGKDRIAAAVGAKSIFPKHPCLVIDAGTCITTDIVDESGNYLGGSIAPGINMRLEAMHHFTKALPKVEMRNFYDLTGSNTEESLLVGAQTATVLEVDGFIDSYKKRYEDLKVLIAGGDTPVFESHLKNEIFAAPNLVLTGLYQILKFNATQ